MAYSPAWVNSLGAIVLLGMVTMPARAEVMTSITEQMDIKDWSTLYRQASDYDAQQRYPEAEALYRWLISQPQPASMNDYMYFYIQVELGRNLQSQGKLAAAIAVFQQVLTTAPDNPASIWARSGLEQVREQLQESESKIAKGLRAIQSDATSPWGYRDFAEGLAVQQQLTQGWGILEEKLGRPLSWVQALELARAAEAVYQHEAAIVLYRQLVQRYPDNPVARSEFLAVLDAWGQPEAAIVAYREAIQRDPALMWSYWRSLTRKLEAVGRWHEARQVYEQLIQQQPSEPDVYLDLGRLFEQTQQDDLALQTYLQGIQAFPNHRPSDRGCHVVRETSYDRLVKFLTRHQRLDQVLAILEQTQPHPPGETYLNLVIALQIEGHPDLAKQVIDQRLHDRHPNLDLDQRGRARCGSDSF